MKSNFILLVVIIVLVGVSYHIKRIGTLEQRVDNLKSMSELCPDCGFVMWTDSWCEHHMGNTSVTSDTAGKYIPSKD